MSLGDSRPRLTPKAFRDLWAVRQSGLRRAIVRTYRIGTICQLRAMRGMLLPRFSIRTLLVLLTLGAAASVVVGMAFHGHAWAWAVSIAILCLAVTAIVHAAWFALIWRLARVPATSES